MRKFGGGICWIVLLALVLAGCTPARADPDSLDAIATDFVHLMLEIEQRDPGHIAAYFGPPQWEEEARKSPRSLPQLAQAAAELTRRAGEIPSNQLDEASRQRRNFLIAQLAAANTRLRVLRGEKLSFAEEVQGQFGVQPTLRPLSAYDALLKRIDAMLPGSGSLADRVDAFENRFVIAPDRVDQVMRAAIAECRRRTVQHIKLPPGETFELSYVKGENWSGSNLYLGNRASLIEMSVDLPVRMNRTIDLACHEVYPGHHVLQTLLEDRLARDRQWIEFTIYPRFSPQSLVAEGAAGYGTSLAFPLDERLDFEREALFPLAGLPVAEAGRYRALLETLHALESAQATIARDYLEGRIDRKTTVELTRKYQLVSLERARRSVAFLDEYRSYAIIYGIADDLVRAHIERVGSDTKSRWAALEKVISEPTLPDDLMVH